MLLLTAVILAFAFVFLYQNVPLFWRTVDWFLDTMFANSGLFFLLVLLFYVLLRLVNLGGL